MNKNIEYTSFSVKPGIILTNAKKDTKVDTLNYYKELMEKKQIIDMQFASADPEGNFYKYIGDVKIIMNNKESTIRGNAYDPYSRSKRMEYKYDVLVNDVNFDERIITVSHHEAIRTQRSTFRRELNKKLNQAKKEEGNKVIIPAKITKIDKGRNVVILDLYGMGVPGYILSAQWKYTFTDDVSKYAKVGESVTVEVMYYKKNALGANGVDMYCCSRKSLVDNPWIGIEETFKVKQIVEVMCVQKRKNSWFGIIEGFDSIQVFCEYPDSDKSTGLQIVEGIKYHCHIYAVSEEKRLLKARPFKMILEE